MRLTAARFKTVIVVALTKNVKLGNSSQAMLHFRKRTRLPYECVANVKKITVDKSFQVNVVVLCLTGLQEQAGCRSALGLVPLTPFPPFAQSQFFLSPPVTAKFSSLHHLPSQRSLLPVDLPFNAVNLTLNDVHHLLKLQEQLNKSTHSRLVIFRTCNRVSETARNV